MNYVLKPKDDELYHWKYIKKVKKPNGKWRYYYDTKQLKKDLGVDKLKEYDREYQEMNTALDKYKDASIAIDEFESANRNTNYKDYDYEKSHELYSRADIRRDSYERNAREFAEARAEVMNTPMSVVVKSKETIRRGKRLVLNLFN